MPSEDGRAAARQAVMAAMSEQGIAGRAELARAAGIDAGTAGDFLNGQRWPVVRTLAKIDRALGWEPGTLAAIGEGLTQPPTETVSASDDDLPDLLYRAPAGVSPEQWAGIRREAEAWIEWQIAKAARER